MTKIVDRRKFLRAVGAVALAAVVPTTARAEPRSEISGTICDRVFDVPDDHVLILRDCKLVNCSIVITGGTVVAFGSCSMDGCHPSVGVCIQLKAGSVGWSVLRSERPMLVTSRGISI